ncbi:uncharacterized protein LOC141655238 [Silene latifolia]|uniref:uncharacterized protein LOC141655238 n=1 Tax=Silene latifolia TaxID=37657 RepID=UPI003D774F14
MSGDLNPPPPPQTPKLHPVYSVTNIQHKVRVLDGVKVPYSSWVKLFKLHARGYKVFHHIDGTRKPSETDSTYEEWCEIDSHVLQWIYGTLNDDLLSRVLEDESTAYEAWIRVKNIFTNNKGARAVALEAEFSSLKLESMPSLEAYCQRLKEIASQLKDVDAAVTDQRLVLQLVRGLTTGYDTTAAYINQTLPTFDNAVSMLELEQRRQASREEPSTALVAPSSPTDEATGWVETKASSSNPPRAQTGGGRPQKNSGRRGGRSQNRGQNKPQTTSHTPNWVQIPWSPSPWSQSWTAPPCPYPTQPGWSSPWQPWPMQQPPRGPQRPPWRAPVWASQQSPGQAYVADFEPQQLTDLGQAFNAMAFNPNDGQWYMDTGATSHLTSDAGSFIPSSTVSNIRSIYVGSGHSIPVRGPPNGENDYEEQ